MSWLISILLASAMFAPNAASTADLHRNSASENKIIVAAADETERFEQIYPLDATGRIGVSNVNGSITIATWDSPQVKLEYVKTADSRERLSEVEIKIDARRDSLQIETEYEKTGSGKGNRNWNNNQGKLMVEYRLTVPRTAVLDGIETVNGSINISDAANMTKASTVNGAVRATNLRGTAQLSTVNGTVRADFDRLAPGSRIFLEAVNGTVDLTIPSDADATLRADTVNGSITNDFGLPVRKGEFVGKDLYGKLGTGDVSIKLASVNGSLSVKRKNDGKNINPAQNLLPQKNRDDDFNRGDALIDTEQLNKEVARAVAEAKKVVVSEKEIAHAIKDAEREIAGIDFDKTAAEALRQVKEGVRQAKEAMRQINDADYFNGVPKIEEKSGSFVVKGIPKVTIEAGGASVVVRGSDKPEVSYLVVKISANHNNSTLNTSAVKDVSDVSIKVTNIDRTTSGGNFYTEPNRVRVEVFVPRKSDLKITGDGAIRLEGVSGNIDLQGADDSVDVRDAGGALSVKTADGAVRVVGFRGAFTGKTADGAMNLEGDFQSLNASSGDGTIVLTLPENANAVLESNVEIETDGVSPTRENADSKVWRVGSGGAIYKLNVADGRVVVRGAGKLKTD